MAKLNNRYGWHWTEPEMASRQQSLVTARRTAEKVRRQLPLIAHFAPKHSAQAERIYAQIAETIAALEPIELRRARRRKYQQLSVEKVDAQLERFHSLMQKWRTMELKPEYIAVVKAANQETRRENDKTRRENRQYMQERNHRLETEEEAFRKFADGLGKTLK